MTLNPGRIWAIVTRHLYIYRASPIRVLEMVYWPLLDLLVWGFVSVALNKGGMSLGATSVVSYFLGGLILWDLFFRAQQGVSLAYMEEVWARNLLNLFVSPLTTEEFVGASLLISLLKLVPSVTVMAVCAFALYHFNLLSIGPALLPFIVALLGFGWALGVMTTALVLRLGQGAESMVWVVAFLVQPIACVFYPVSVLPGWLQPVALATPCAHVFEGMHAVMAGQALDWGRLGWAFGLDLVYMTIAVVIFARTFAYVRAQGLLAKTGE